MMDGREWATQANLEYCLESIGDVFKMVVPLAFTNKLMTNKQFISFQGVEEL